MAVFGSFWSDFYELKFINLNCPFQTLKAWILCNEIEVMVLLWYNIYQIIHTFIQNSVGTLCKIKDSTYTRWTLTNYFKNKVRTFWVLAFAFQYLSELPDWKRGARNWILDSDMKRKFDNIHIFWNYYNKCLSLYHICI